MSYALYRLLMWLMVPLALLRLLWRGRKQSAYRQNIAERFGYYSGKVTDPVIWVHAVSVGETRAAEPLVHALLERFPQKKILVTNMTPTGRATVNASFGERVLHCYLPYDLAPAVDRFLSHFQPNVGIILETELWPTLVARCTRRGVPVHLVNARLSARSAKRYSHFAGLTRQMLTSLATLCVQTERDAERFRTLGASKVQITGNIKFDRIAPEEQLHLGAHLRHLFGTGRRIFLAASTRDGEEELVLRAFDKPADPATLIVVVPRHPQRFNDVAELLRRKGLAFQRRSDGQAVAADTMVVLGDSMGEMFAYYAACDVAFIGGSLLPLGGQNLLEACAVAKPVIVGPHTFNFEEATEQAIAAGAAIRVSDADALATTVSVLLSDPDRAQAIGEAGRQFMQIHRGATERTLNAIGH